MKKDTSETKSRVLAIKEEINAQLADPDTLKSLLDTTFKGLEAPVAKRAMLEGMMRGFSFQDFLEKNVYAIPYGSTYSLVTSVDYSRKIGMRSGVIGDSAPTYVMDGQNIESCSVTIKRRVGNDIGEYTATVYFREYSTGKNLWSSKPRTMIAKVAEMHALRKACPEELAQSYVEEEIQRETIKEVPSIDLTMYETALRDSKTLEEFEIKWADIPGQAKVSLKNVLEEMKQILITESKPIV